MQSTTSRTAVVTGAARGIGAGVARRLAADGLAVGVLDVDGEGAESTAAAIRAAGGRAVAMGADVADEAQVAAALADVTDDLGPPTVVVNNAGFARDTPLADMGAEQWDAVVDVHLRGAFLVTRAALPHMVAAGWGRVVNVSSISALGHAGRANYCAAKAGLIGFTRSLAAELGPQGVTVNAVAPGFVVSDMTAATARRLGRSVDEHQRIAAASIPVRRVGQPEDIANAVAFFADPAAGYVTGQVLYVSGGPEG